MIALLFYTLGESKRGGLDAADSTTYRALDYACGSCDDDDGAPESETRRQCEKEVADCKADYLGPLWAVAAVTHLLLCCCMIGFLVCLAHNKEYPA